MFDDFGKIHAATGGLIMPDQHAHSDIITPLADAVLRLTNRDVLSMHALPWSQRKALIGSSIEDAYDDILGASLPHADFVYAGGALDSFFRPNAALDLAQHCAAEVFGADYTFFVSCGGRVAARIALSTFLDPATRVLLCAPSSVMRSEWIPESAEVTPAPHLDDDRLPNVPALLDLLEDGEAQGHPFQVVALAGPRAGLGFDYPRLIEDCLKRSPDLTFVIDESCKAIHNFHDGLRPMTALGAAATMARRWDTRIRMLVIHEANQTMTAAPQGAYLHVTGPVDLVEAVRRSVYSLHTTSPSFPILASLDLARAHAQEHGASQVDRALSHASTVRRLIADEGRKLRIRTTYPPYIVSNPMSVEVVAEEPDLRTQRWFDSLDGRPGYLGDNRQIRLTATQRGLVVSPSPGCRDQDLTAFVHDLRSLSG